MRITFVIASADMAGGCKVVALYAKRLEARGHEVLVVAPPRWRGTFRQRLRMAMRGDVSALLPASRHESHLELLGVARHYLERRRPVAARDVPDADVIVATWWETAEWISRLPRYKGAPVYFIQGNEADLVPDSERVLRTWDLPYERVVISSWLGDLVEARTGERPELVPNTIDRGQFDAPPRGKAARPTLGLVYSSTGIKGFDVAAKVIERVRAQLPNLRVICFSSEAPNAELPLPPGVEHTLRPPQDRIRDLYAACDVWLSTSRAEGFGLPALEAMACRTPLVSTRYGGPADFLRDGENGFLTKVDDVSELSERCLEVLRWPVERWRTMSDAAYATAHAYTWDDAAASMEAVFERAAASRR